MSILCLTQSWTTGKITIFQIAWTHSISRSTVGRTLHEKLNMNKRSAWWIHTRNVDREAHAKANPSESGTFHPVLCRPTGISITSLYAGWKLGFTAMILRLNVKTCSENILDYQHASNARPPSPVAMSRHQCCGTPKDWLWLTTSKSDGEHFEYELQKFHEEIRKTCREKLRQVCGCCRTMHSAHTSQEAVRVV